MTRIYQKILFLKNGYFLVFVIRYKNDLWKPETYKLDGKSIKKIEQEIGRLKRKIGCQRKEAKNKFPMKYIFLLVSIPDFPCILSIKKKSRRYLKAWATHIRQPVETQEHRIGRTVRYTWKRNIRDRLLWEENNYFCRRKGLSENITPVWGK